MVRFSVWNIESEGEVPLEQNPPVIFNLNISIKEVNQGCYRTFDFGRRVFHPDGSKKLESVPLSFRVPPGTRAGQTFVFPGEGDRTTPKRPADVIVIIRDKPHHYFVRDKENLKYTVKMEYKDAQQGTLIQIPTLDGPMLFNVFKPGYMEIIKGKGLPVAGDETGQLRGDLRIFFEYPRTPGRIAPMSFYKL